VHIIFILILAIINIRNGNQLFELLFIIVIFFLFILFLGNNGQNRFIFNNKYLAIIGGMCYTIYLYHVAIIYIFSLVFLKLQLDPNYFSFFLFITSCLALIILISSFLFLVFEKPFMKKNWYQNLKELALIRAK
jgi:peptidoglycan/LPS O-acetylase OafA/YrhL